MPEPEEPLPSDGPWIYRAWMHMSIRFHRHVLRLLGDDTSETDELLAENRRLRRELRDVERKQRRAELSEIVVPASTVRVAMGSVATFRLINPDPNRRYECCKAPMPPTSPRR